MNGFEKRRQRKKNAIIAAAFELFRKEGIDAVRVTDIAKKAGVSKVSIYNYFVSKEELARQVLRDFMDKKLLEVKRFMESELSFKEKFEISYRMRMGTIGEVNAELISDYYKMMSSPEMQEFIKTYYETNTRPLIMELIEQGKREGDVDPDLSNEAVLIYIEAFRDLALSKSMDKNLLIDLTRLIFYGLKGK